MLIKAIAMSAAAGLLITSAAQAQTAQSYTDTTHATQKAPQSNTGASMSSSMSSTSSTTVNPGYSAYPAAAATTYSTDVAATYPASSYTGLTTTTQLITSMPVADTPSNRALYRPLSRAGNRTAPRGN